ncbi:DUF134 domain-containing protein [Deferrisoma camini]|uniref:DUF134 domain-containing protein n=1 Tax=Deferrisoma camini TaxID=1035120 RepID=UPI00046CD7F7|nr:DUF134 domain-containing protein [Deferrisoma camini]
MSPRPKKPRRCGCAARLGFDLVFKPAGIPLSDLAPVVLELDELEALRLCDAEDLTQEEAGRRMGVSRGTVQRLLATARKKTALALSEGRALVVRARGTGTRPLSAPERCHRPPCGS